MLSSVTITAREWPIVGRRAELEVFEAVLGSREHAGIVIHGRAGVGETRLADECREWAAEETRRVLLERHQGRRLVTVADDVSLLDAASLALLGYLAAQGAIFLIATVRTGEPGLHLISGLWRDGRCERIDLEDLSATHLDTLLHLALGGPIEAGAGQELWKVTRGNPLYVRELVLGARESGAFVERSGVWHLEGRLTSTSRLPDLVEQRISGLSAQARAVVELLALCQPLELGYLETTVPSDVPESLERVWSGQGGLAKITG